MDMNSIKEETMKRSLFVSLTIIAALVLSGCNFPLLAQNQTETPDLLSTSVAETVQAMNLLPQATQTPLTPPTPDLGQPTSPPLPTPPSGAQPTSPVNPCNKAKFLGETIPDDTEFDPGESFTKSWTFENAGTCTWNTNYKLAFVSGESMGGPASVSMPVNVPPGTQVKIEVPLKAPNTPGTYTGYWELRSEDNEGFYQVYVRIKVVSVDFAVTSVYTNLKNVSPESCPYTYAVDVSIVTNAAGKVTYKTETSEGGVSALKTLNFDSADTMIVEFNWAGLGEAGTTKDYWLKVYIDSPNHQWFGPFNFSITCP